MSRTKFTATPKGDPPKHSVSAAELARIIDDAALFACRDSSLPMINAIRLESTPKQLIAVATDRFTLGASMASYGENSGTEFAASLKLVQAQTLAKIAKSCKAAFTDVTITATDGKLTFEFTSGESLTLPTVAGTGDFPDWRQLVVEKADGDDPVKIVGYNPAYLAKFSRVHGASRIAMKFAGPGKAALVSVGTQFVGLIMPVRLGADDPEWQHPDWLAAPEPAPKPKPRKRAPRKAAA